MLRKDSVVRHDIMMSNGKKRLFVHEQRNLSALFLTICGHLFQKELNNDNLLFLMHYLFSKENIEKANIPRDKKIFYLYYKEEEFVM